VTTDDFPPDYRDPYTGMTAAELAAEGDRAEAAVGDPAAWEDADFETDPAVRVVFTVRISRDEAATIGRAADSTGVPLSTFIRNAALAAAMADTVDLPRAREQVQALLDDLERLRAIMKVAQATDPRQPGRAAS
jgi:hypothetical protein